MSYSKKRIDYNNKWPDEIIEFSGQRDFTKLMKDKGISNILRPIQLPLITDFQFQRLLSFKIDIYEQLPERPDIAFDLAWRTFEAYCTFMSIQLSWSVSKTWKILNKVTEDILEPQYNNNIILEDAHKNLINSIPLQATEFLARRMLENQSAAIKSQQRQIIERAKDSLGENLFNAIKTKYGNLTPENQRKAGMVLQLLANGEKLEIEGQQFQLSRIKITKFLINSILYTYRNERFHGDAFSPFKSSKTKIKTYAHSYYLLICTYFFISQLIYKHNESVLNLDEIGESLSENSVRYNLIFGNQRKK